MTGEPDKSLDACARLVTEIPAAVALFDRELRYVAASPAWIEAFGLADVEPSEHRHGDISGIGRGALEYVQRQALAGTGIDGCPLGADASLPALSRATLGARPHRHPDGSVAGAVVALRVVEPAAPVDADAVPTDPVTGLPDRSALVRHIDGVLDEPDPPPGALVVLAVHLDNLRSINALHGFGVGDDALRITADRLLSGTRSRGADETGPTPRGHDTVARLGAGEFAVICGPPALAAGDAEALATRLLRLVESPIALAGRSIRLGASIGMVATTSAHRTADAVLRDAEIALQRARGLGPGKITTWDPPMTRAATRAYTLGEELRRAFDNGEFVMHYQPVLRLDDSRVVGAEALLRWNHPSEGLAPSAAFLPALEAAGLMGEVGCWVVREAVRQIETWRTLYGRNIVEWIGLNLSARQLADPARLLETLRSIHDGGFAVHRLKLEVAEPVLLGCSETAGLALAELGALGVGLAIDDFGTGAGSLEGLRRFAVDTVKIDGAFIAQIGTADGERLLQALFDVARMSGAAVIAENIETAAQLDFLRRIGGDLGQGYLLAEPMDGALLGVYALTNSVQAEGAQSDIKRSVTGRVMRRGA